MSVDNPKTLIRNEILKLQQRMPDSPIVEIYQQGIGAVLETMEDCDLKNTLLGYSLMFELEPTMIRKDTESFQEISKIHDIVTDALVDIAEDKCGCQLKG